MMHKSKFDENKAAKRKRAPAAFLLLFFVFQQQLGIQCGSKNQSIESINHFMKFPKD